MIKTSTAMVFFAALGSFACVPLSAADRCVAMTAQQRAEVETYVRKKFKVAPATALQITETPAAPSTCFRKIEFKSTGQSGKFNMALYASPDMRFLTTQLLDIKVDPEEEERKREAKFRAGLNTGDSPALGPANAPVTLTVFSDFQCPYCSMLAKTLREDVIPKERGNVRVVFRYFPLEMHSWAKAAAEAEVCANEQSTDLFWKLHDFLFENQRTFTPENVTPKILEQAARFQRINKARFSGCLADKGTAARIERDVAFGTANGVRGTPTIFVNGRKADVGAAPEQIRSLIREAGASERAAR
jgi:protein-disulfide isomerase